MADIYNGRYALADPGSGLTVVSLEDGELNMFGSCTRIRTTQWESYPEIEDEPMVLHAGDCIKEKLHTGLAELAALAGVAAARVTERAALEPYICALGGVASLMTGGGTGYMAGAAVYGIRAAVPAASLLTGTKAGRMPGTSRVTAAMVPDIAAGCMLNDTCSDSSSYKTLLDKLFNKDTDASETFGMALAMFVEDYPGLAESDMDQRDKKGGSDEEGLFLEPGSDPYEVEKKNRKEGREYKRFSGGEHTGHDKWRNRILDADGENQDNWGNSQSKSTAGWYSDIAAGTAKGSATNEIFVLSTKSTDKEKFPDIYVYDGLPWEPDSNTYFFDLRKAREDIWPLYEKAGVSKGMLSSMLMTGTVNPSTPDNSQLSEIDYEGQYSATINNIPALGVGVWPAMWKNYYPEYAMKTIEMDGITANWTYKMAIVVVDKGEDVSDPSKWKYVPATRISSKAHTFYGGVLQTNVKLDGGKIILSKSDSGWMDNISVGYVSNYGSDEESVVKMLKDIVAKGGRLGDWWLHYVETYNIDSNMKDINDNYDFAGYVIYGDTFMYMS